VSGPDRSTRGSAPLIFHQGELTKFLLKIEHADSSRDPAPSRRAVHFRDRLLSIPRVRGWVVVVADIPEEVLVQYRIGTPSPHEEWLVPAFVVAKYPYWVVPAA
jgi:hypothetical protein